MGSYYGGAIYDEDNTTFVTVPDGGSQTNLNFFLPDGEASIAGTVRDTTGDPIGNADIYTDIIGSPYVWWYSSNQSDPGGNYQIKGLPARQLTMYAYHYGYVETYYNNAIKYNDAEEISLGIGDHLTGMDFTLRTGATLRVAVLDKNGLPPHPQNTETLPDNTIVDIMQDSEFDLWFATNQGLMGIVNNVTMGLNTYNSDLPTNNIRAMADSGWGTKYYATDVGVVKQTSSGITVYNTSNSSLPSNDCTAIMFGPGSNIYIGTEDSYFVKWNGSDSFTSYTYSDRGETSASKIRCLANDNGDIVYIGTDYGMTEYAVSTAGFTNHTTSGGLLSNYVFAIGVAGDGTVWIGTQEGINRDNPSGPDQTYTTTEGLPNNSIFDLYVVNADDVWIGTYSGGISHFSSGTFTNYTSSTSDLSSDYIRSIYRWNGRTYIGTTNGLDIFDGSSFGHITKYSEYKQVNAYEREQQLSYSRSGSDTELNITGMVTGTYEVYITSNSYPKMYYDGVYLPNEATLISVTEGHVSSQRYLIELEHGGSISGMAEDHESNPLTSGTVYAYPTKDLSQKYQTNIITPTSEYQFNNLPPFNYYVSLYNNNYPVMFYNNVYSISDAAVITVYSGMDTPNINFGLHDEADGTISGKAKDSDGHPYQNASVHR